MSPTGLQHDAARDRDGADTILCAPPIEVRSHHARPLDLELDDGIGLAPPDSVPVRVVPMPIAGPGRSERVRTAAALALTGLGLAAFAMAAAAIALG